MTHYYAKGTVRDLDLTTPFWTSTPEIPIVFQISLTNKGVKKKKEILKTTLFVETTLHKRFRNKQNQIVPVFPDIRY